MLAAARGRHAKGGSLESKEREFQKGREVRVKDQKALGFIDSEAFAHFGSCNWQHQRPNHVGGREEDDTAQIGSWTVGKETGQTETSRDLGRSVVCLPHALNPCDIYGFIKMTENREDANHQND